MLSDIQQTLKDNSEADFAEKMKTVAPGAKRIYGVRMPVLNEIAKVAKDGGFELIEQLWEAGAYEERMLAAKTLHKVAKKDPEKAIALVKKYSKAIDNWALCDTLGMQSLKAINKIRSKEIFALANELSSSPVMWQRRLSMVLLEDFCKQPVFHNAIQEMVNKHKGDKEYYIKKAVIWLEASLKKHQ